jgi:hypothetical protein
MRSRSSAARRTGAPHFRFGVVRVPEPDFALIAAAMGRSFAADFAAPAKSPQLST